MPPWSRAAVLALLVPLARVASAEPAPPDAPYEAGSLSLTAEEQALLVSAPAGQAVRTNRQILSYVTAAEVGLLRARAASGAVVDEADRALAARLYWTRGALLSDADTEFLRALAALRYGEVPAAPSASGGVVTGRTSGVSAAAPWRLDPARVDAALAGLRRLVVVDDHNDSAEKAALDDAFRRVVHTRTGLEFAEEFVRIGKPAKLSFEAVDPDGGGVIERNGRKILLSSGGESDIYKDPPWVRLNKLYLQTSSGYREPEIAMAIAHELLGHVVLHFQAQAGGALTAKKHWRDDETNAGLVGWLVRAEQGAPLSDPWMWSYLFDPDRYHAELNLVSSYYAGTFSRTEMADPVAALRVHRAAAERRLRRVAAERRQEQALSAAVDHFVSAHGAKKEAFASLLDGVSIQLVQADRNEANLKTIAARIDDQIKEFTEPAGRVIVQEMQDQSRKPALTAADGQLARLTERLRRETCGLKPVEYFPPDPPGQIGSAKLKRMIEADRKVHPAFWRQWSRS